MAVPHQTAAQGRPRTDGRLDPDPHRLQQRAERQRRQLSYCGNFARSASARTRLTTLLGMAKPIPILPALLSLVLGLKSAELMPTSSPWRLSSAPPELPGLIGASVWMK